MPQAAESFLRSILGSGVMDREELRSALRGITRESLKHPQAIANHLIGLNKLSRFQAGKLLAGATVGLKLGPYILQAPIGRGGMGWVYLALDTRNGQHVAIKVLPPRKAKEEERHLARFLREMTISRRVSHPHIAKTHEAGAWQGVNYLAMEYIPGKSLYRLVAAEGPLPMARAARLFSEVATGLEYAHGLGLIHRDLKPSNIMVTPNDHAKVLDLGLAMMEGEVGQDIEVIGGRGYVVGSVEYMAPEQTEDATQVDARSDIYALGCTMVFALTGKTLFPGGSLRDKVMAQRHQQPEPIQQRNPAITDAFAAVVHTMLAKNPAERFASATEVVLALLPFCSQEPQTVKPVEKEGDSVYQAAVAALEEAPVQSDVAVELVPPQLVTFADDSILDSGFFQEREKSEMRRIILAIAGFWGVVLLILLIVILLR